MAHLYPRLHLWHGLLLLVLEVDGFILYCPEFALLLSILCQNLLKRFFSVSLSFLLSIANISLLPVSYHGLYMRSTLMHCLYKITISSQVMLAVISITIDITIDLPDILLVISLSTSFGHNCRFSSYAVSYIYNCRFASYAASYIHNCRFPSYAATQLTNYVKIM